MQTQNTQDQMPQSSNINGQGNPYMDNQPSADNMNFPGNYSEKLNDVEAGVPSPVDVHMMIRMGFIRKVFGILSAQLAITVSLMCIAFEPSVNEFLRTSPACFWVAFGLSLAIVFPLLCFRKLARGVPQNYILLFLWTLCESYMLATAVAFYDPKVVMLAGVMTLLVTVSLTIYAFTTKTDFTFCGGILFAASCILLVWSLFSIIFGFVLNSLYCILGLIIYSIYLIFDIQLIVGKFGVEYNVDDYIYAALNIYIDIIQIFLYILQLFGGRK